MSDIAKIDEILTKAEVFYLATVNGDKPKVRPLGFHLLFEDKIYFGVGTFKEVYKQLEANQNVEIAAWDGEHFLRYYGTVDLTKNQEMKLLSKKHLNSCLRLKKLTKQMAGKWVFSTLTMQQLKLEICLRLKNHMNLSINVKNINPLTFLNMPNISIIRYF